MSTIKERILGAVSVMNDSDAEFVWNLILDNFPRRNSWNDIPETEPDEFDLKMLREAATDPECREFIPENELLKELGLDDGGIE